MTEMQRFQILATQLQHDDPTPIVLPITRTGRRYDGGYYVCKFCQKKFTEVASIRRHQTQYCTSYRESERPVSDQRLMGG
jgi:hypothetical protein